MTQIYIALMRNGYTVVCIFMSNGTTVQKISNTLQQKSMALCFKILELGELQCRQVSCLVTTSLPYSTLINSNSIWTKYTTP